jgi:hypothetical protein
MNSVIDAIGCIESATELKTLGLDFMRKYPTVALNDAGQTTTMFAAAQGFPSVDDYLAAQRAAPGTTVEVIAAVCNLKKVNFASYELDHDTDMYIRRFCLIDENIWTDVVVRFEGPGFGHYNRMRLRNGPTWPPRPECDAALAHDLAEEAKLNEPQQSVEMIDLEPRTPPRASLPAVGGASVVKALTFDTSQHGANIFAHSATLNVKLSRASHEIVRDAGARLPKSIEPEALITAHSQRRTQVTIGYKDSDGKVRQSLPFLMIVAPNINSTLKLDIGCAATKVTLWSTKFALPVFLSAEHQRFLDDCERRLADALYIMSFPATSAVAPHINEIRQESADATQFCARLFETTGVYPAYVDGVALAERVLEGASTKVAKLDTPNMTLNLLAGMGKQFNWPATGHVTTQGVREDHTANNTESFTAIKGLAAGRPVLLHVGVVGVISVSKNSGKLYAKVRA